MKTARLALKIAEEFERQEENDHQAGTIMYGQGKNLDATYLSGSFNLITLAKAIKKVLKKAGTDTDSEPDDRAPLLPGEKFILEHSVDGKEWSATFSPYDRPDLPVVVIGRHYADVIQKARDAIRQYRDKTRSANWGTKDIAIKVTGYKCRDCEYLDGSLTKLGEHYRREHGSILRTAQASGEIPIHFLKGEDND